MLLEAAHHLGGVERRAPRPREHLRVDVAVRPPEHRVELPIREVEGVDEGDRVATERREEGGDAAFGSGLREAPAEQPAPAEADDVQRPLRGLRVQEPLEAGDEVPERVGSGLARRPSPSENTGAFEFSLKFHKTLVHFAEIP